MPTLTIDFDVPSAAVPKIRKLMERMNRDRVEAGDAPFDDEADMIEKIAKNRLKLLIKEAEREERNQAKLALKDATPEQIEAIQAILDGS